MEIWETVMNKLTTFKKVFPYGEVTIDEKLFPSKSGRGFIQYMPSKLRKFGIKFWMLCDAKISYVLRATP